MILLNNLVAEVKFVFLRSAIVSSVFVAIVAFDLKWVRCLRGLRLDISITPR